MQYVGYAAPAPKKPTGFLDNFTYADVEYYGDF